MKQQLCVRHWCTLSTMPPDPETYVPVTILSYTQKEKTKQRLLVRSITWGRSRDISEPQSNSTKLRIFTLWYSFSLHLDTESNSARMQPDAASNQPQTVAHFQSIGSTEVELPHTRQTQLRNRLSKRCLDVLWCFTPENSSLQRFNFRKHNLFPSSSRCARANT